MKKIIELTYKEKLVILEWRNNPNVSKFMINKKIELKEHLNFINSLQNNNTKKYFLVADIGVIYFTNITNEKAEIGLYKNPSKKRVGSKLMEEIINYGFNKLKVKKLILYVYENNKKAINLYKKFGFKEVDEFNFQKDRKENIIKMELINATL